MGMSLAAALSEAPMQKRPETENVSTRFQSHRILFFSPSLVQTKQTQHSKKKGKPIKKAWDW
jgi:hypothetical protein